MLAYDLSLVDFEALQEAGPPATTRSVEQRRIGRSTTAGGVLRGTAPASRAAAATGSVRSSERDRGGERVWRLRKNHTWLDARLRDRADDAGVELQFFYDGALSPPRRWPSREDALTDAERQLRELQRAGGIHTGEACAEC